MWPGNPDLPEQPLLPLKPPEPKKHELDLLRERLRQEIAEKRARLQRRTVNSMNSNIIKDLRNTEWMNHFRTLFVQDYKESLGVKFELSEKQKMEAMKIAEKIVTGDKEHEREYVFVATVPVKRESPAMKRFDEPIGFLTFRIIPQEGGGTGEMVFSCDRIFISEKYRRLGIAPYLVRRALGRAVIENERIGFARFEDPFGFLTPRIIDSMKKMGFFTEVQRRKDRNDIFAEINPVAMAEEVKVIKAFEKLKKAPLLKKPVERIRLFRERRKYYRLAEQRKRRASIIAKLQKRMKANRKRH
ncbi:MAG: GNAT family N-acetyltransferase [Candidatus Diapherotrites archaeon]